jgi:hypothetical protein
MPQNLKEIDIEHELSAIHNCALEEQFLTSIQMAVTDTANGTETLRDFNNAIIPVMSKYNISAKNHITVKASGA